MTRFAYRRIALVGAVIATAGATYLALRPPVASPAAQPPVALLLVDAKPQGMLPGGPVPTPAEGEMYRRTQAALIKSEFVINAALRDPKLRELEAVRKQPDPVAWLAEHLSTDLGEGSSVLRIGVTGVPPKDAALLANAVAGAFLKEVVEREIRVLRERRQRVEATQTDMTRVLDARKNELIQLATIAGVPANAADYRALLASLYQERTGLRLELARTRGEKDAGPREKRLWDDLAVLDNQIKSCERADLDPARAAVARLEAAVNGLSTELTRLEVEMNAPPRVTFLAPAAVPGSDTAP